MSVIPATQAAGTKPRRWAWVLIALFILVLLACVAGFVAVRYASFSRRLAAYKAQLAMQQALSFQTATGRWPASPSELAPAYIQPTAASRMQSEGYVFDIAPDGSFFIRWQHRGRTESMDVRGQVDPPLP